MNKKVLIGLGLLLGVIVLGGVFATGWVVSKKVTLSQEKPISPLNATYYLEGNGFSLSNGSAEQAIVPGSADKITTSILIYATPKDVNGDGVDDGALVFSRTTQGKTLYYLAAAVWSSTTQQFTGTNLLLIGQKDFLTPKSVSVENQEISVECTTNSFYTAPTDSVRHFVVRGSQLIEKQKVFTSASLGFRFEYPPDFTVGRDYQSNDQFNTETITISNGSASIDIQASIRGEVATTIGEVLKASGSPRNYTPYPNSRGLDIVQSSNGFGLTLNFNLGKIFFNVEPTNMTTEELDYFLSTLRQ